VKKLEQGFAKTGSKAASKAGKKGAASRKKLMAERKKKGEKQWEGGFVKGALVTKLRAKLAVAERWRRYYEEKEKELLEIRASMDEAEVEERVRNAQRLLDGVVGRVRSHEAIVRDLQNKIAVAEDVERSIQFGAPSALEPEEGMMSGNGRAQEGKEA